MSHNLLKGKRGIIFGALNDMSIAWKVAERAVEEGATITLSNTPIAVRMGRRCFGGEVERAGNPGGRNQRRGSGDRIREVSGNIRW